MTQRVCAASKVLAASVVYATCTMRASWCSAWFHRVQAAGAFSHDSGRTEIGKSLVPHAHAPKVRRRLQNFYLSTPRAHARVAAHVVGGCRNTRQSHRRGCGCRSLPNARVRMFAYAYASARSRRPDQSEGCSSPPCRVARACALASVSASACLHAVFLMAVIPGAGAGAAGGAGAAAPGGLAGIC